MSSASTIRPYTDVKTVAFAAPTLVFTAAGGSMNVPCSIAITNITGAAHTVYICNADDVDSSRGYPIEAGKEVSLDLQAGDKVYMISVVADVDVRILLLGPK